MYILIAGASGFIGSELANHLSQNHKITVLHKHQRRCDHDLS